MEHIHLDHNYQILLNPSFQDINPILAGEATCPPGLMQHPPKRDCTTLHYVRSGCGTLSTRGKTYSIQARQIFLILPGENATYTADKNDPWTYRWVGFTGASSRIFAKMPPVLTVPQEIFDNLCDLRGTTYNLEHKLTSELFLLQACLPLIKKTISDPVEWVMDHIQSAYMTELSVQKMAEQLNMDRSHLYRIFKKKVGLSIKDYILQVRTRRAKWYLEQGYSIKETSTLCGFKDANNFSRQFKKSEAGMAPLQWQAYIKEVRAKEAP
ncbi:MAG: AraC family transcriptional regulator [Oscillospiraceae bacterium]|nr:AraC family transcriptional regulator [Oscillospiraceae bacterium]